METGHHQGDENYEGSCSSPRNRTNGNQLVHDQALALAAGVLFLSKEQDEWKPLITRISARRRVLFLSKEQDEWKPGLVQDGRQGATVLFLSKEQDEWKP